MSTILETLQEQHNAIDTLMAALIARETEMHRVQILKREELFMPSESGHIWQAIVDGNAAIAAMKDGTDRAEDWLDSAEAQHVLGLMCFMLAGFAHVYRDSGQTIERKTEDEQAFMLTKLLKLVRQYGPKWSEKFGEEFKVVSDRVSSERDNKQLAEMIQNKRSQRVPTRDLPDGRRLWLYPMLHTVRLAIGKRDEDGFDDSWCYENKEAGMSAFEQWNPLDSVTPEPSGWVRHPSTGRRRPNGDQTKEYVNL